MKTEDFQDIRSGCVASQETIFFEKILVIRAKSLNDVEFYGVINEFEIIPPV